MSRVEAPTCRDPPCGGQAHPNLKRTPTLFSTLLIITLPDTYWTELNSLSSGSLLFPPSLIDGREQIIQRLGQRRMSKDGIAQDGIRDLAYHRHFQDGHDLTAFDAQDSSTENLFRIGIHYRFHETSRLVHF